MTLLSEFLCAGRRLLFPPRCLGCELLLPDDHSYSSLCPSCYGQIEQIEKPYCRICGIPYKSSKENTPLCSACLTNPPPFTFCQSLFIYNEVMRRLIVQFKFKRDLVSYHIIESLLSKHDLGLFLSSDIVIPVPLHPARLRSRGGNQSLLLARMIFTNNRRKIRPNLLQRVKNTIPQSALRREQRQKNLKNVFVIPKPDELYGKTICLIDDVYTTGTTLTECSKTLLNSGCSEIRVLTLARAIVK